MKCGASTRAGKPCKRKALPNTDPPRCHAHAESERDWAIDFLFALRLSRMVSAACEHVGIDRAAADRRRAEDPDFDRAWEEIDAEITDALEREAFRRAALGVEREIYYQGEVVGRERQFSDSLLAFLLKRQEEKLGQGPMVTAVQRDLDALAETAPDLAHSGIAASALTLAREMDDPTNSPAAKASCARALLDTLDRIRELTPAEDKPKGDRLDELSARRAARRHSAGRSEP